MFWYTLEVCKAARSLFALPFLIFILIPADIVTGAEATGYDRPAA